MAITFHCEHCGKKIEAPDDKGAKRGNCPACHNKVYIPGPDSGEELELAPVDENEEARKKQLMTETHKLTQDILLERETPNGAVEADVPVSRISDEELTKNIIVYLQQMADGELDQAQKTSDSIVSCGARAVKILDRIALSEIPEPELADIPLQVLSGLIRNFRTKIS